MDKNKYVIRYEGKAIRGNWNLIYIKSASLAKNSVVLEKRSKKKGKSQMGIN